MDEQRQSPDPPPEPAPPALIQQVGQARGLLESAAGVAVITAALYLLGVVHEEAYFERFGIQPLYLDTPPSLYVFRGAPAVAVVLLFAYWVFLIRAIGTVVGSVLRRGPRATLRAFFLPRPGEVRRKGEVLPFVAARIAFLLLLLSPMILTSSASFVLRLDLDTLSLFLALVLAASFAGWGTIRGPLLRHVPEASQASLERLLLVAAVFGLAIISAHRTGELEAAGLVTGAGDGIVKVNLRLYPQIADALPPGDYYAVLMTDDHYYLMRQECPPPDRPHVVAVPRINVAAADIRAVDPTPEATPDVPIPEIFIPRGFCWQPEDFPTFEGG